MCGGSDRMCPAMTQQGTETLRCRVKADPNLEENMPIISGVWEWYPFLCPMAE